MNDAESTEIAEIDETVPVFIVSNDVVPGMGMSVAAPGLRCHGLAEGLAAAGIPVTQLVADGPAGGAWHSKIPVPTRPGVELVSNRDLPDYLRGKGPAVVVAINSNRIDAIPQDPELRLVVDLFAPRALEVTYRSDDYPIHEVREIRTRNLRAFERADGFIINGTKKRPYYLGWLMQVDRDHRKVQFHNVPMAMPKGFDLTERTAEHPGPVQVATAGYMQGWSQPGAWLRVVADEVADHNGTFNALLVQRQGVDNGADEFCDAFDHPAVQLHKEMLFADFQQFMSGMDLAVDLFDWSAERELAMITRTVGAISCGLPVIHPPWSEVSPYIERYDAGWLVDPGDEDGVKSVVTEALADRQLREAKAQNAKRLWAEVFNPAVAVGPLVQEVRRLSAELRA